MDVDTYFAHNYRHLMAKFTALKCTAIRDKICEPLITGKVDMCKVFTDKDQFYSYSFQECLHPRLKCPVKKGLYHLRNASITADELLAMVPLNFEEIFSYYWNIKARIYDPSRPKEIVLCINFMFKIDVVKD
ncbi:uncharacterized protein [Halyomorpha halys]|uniref:uncharacterized protein n=1 Tax=Halyomorpha halys TaxID=286706 RepID=UPI0006D511D7